MKDGKDQFQSRVTETLQSYDDPTQEVSSTKTSTNNLLYDACIEPVNWPRSAQLVLFPSRMMTSRCRERMTMSMSCVYGKEVTSVPGREKFFPSRKHARFHGLFGRLNGIEGTVGKPLCAAVNQDVNLFGVSHW